MKLYFSLLLIVVLFNSCCLKSDNSSKLKDIDSFIEYYPDSALNVLARMDNVESFSRKEKAYHALLLSMALDKNFIDKTDFSVLQPAIDYYEKNGNPTERLRMYYYQGTIFKNAGDDEKAIECYVKGLDAGAFSDDSLTKARIYFSKALIHNVLYEYSKYAECMLEAAKYFKGQKPSSYFNALYNAHNGRILCKDSSGAATILNMLANCVDSSNNTQLSKLYEARICFLDEFELSSTALTEVEEYLNKVPSNNIKWLTVASIYNKMWCYKEALQALHNYDYYSLKKDARYYAISSSLHENIGDVDKSLSDYKKYIHFSDSIDMVIFRHDTKFVEERHNMEVAALEKSKQNQRLVFAIAFLIGVVFYIKLKLRVKTLENNNYRLLCSQLEHEKEALLNAMEHKWISKSSLGQIILQRLSLLNTIMAAAITDNYKVDKKAKEELNKLISDRESFMLSTIRAFEISHSGFIAELRAKGLNDLELGYCCLYALGLNGKEIGEYTKMKRHYIVSHEIRKKLLLSEHETNLGKYITKLLKEVAD